MVLFWFFKNLFYIFWPPGDTSKVIALVKASITRVLHVCSCGQGAWGGSLLMSRRHRWKLDGVERQEEFYLFIFFVDETLMKDWNNDELNCVFFFFGLSHLQSQFCHMEPTQNDVCPSAVFSPAGQRGGEATSLTSSPVHTPIQGLKSVLLFVVLFLDRVWCRTATRCTPVTCSSRTNTTICPTTPETKLCSVDGTWTSSSCGSCGGQRSGGKSIFFTKSNKTNPKCLAKQLSLVSVFDDK